MLHHEPGANIGYAKPEPADMPIYELVPLKHVEYGFVAPDHVPESNVFDDRAFPIDIMPADQDAKMALANEWFEKRKLAEGIGGRLEVRAVGDPPPPPPPAPPPAAPPAPGLSGGTPRGLRPRVFGRKGL